jgi:hypothetical protein
VNTKILQSLDIRVFAGFNIDIKVSNVIEGA